jgi:hypothetical protein
MSEMSRGEMIRRLDDVSDLVHDGLAAGPLSRSDRDILASHLATLLPIVAQSLQDEEDRQAAHALLPNPAAWHEKGSTRGSDTGWAAVRVHPRSPRMLSKEPAGGGAQSQNGVRYAEGPGGRIFRPGSPKAG